jgi:hypothetical protein
MKFKLLIALCLALNIAYAQTKTTSNGVKSDNLEITVTEDDNSIEYKSRFNPDLTDKVRAYLNNTLAKGSSTNFKNTEVDAEMKLDNGAFFYINSHPGKLLIKLDKRKNSAEVYKRFKDMCEGLKKIIENK